VEPILEDGLFCGSTIILKNLSEPPEWQLWNPQSPSSGENRIAEYDLRRKDRILAGAALATHQLLITGEKDLAIKQALEILSCSANVDRVFIFEKCQTNCEAEVQSEGYFFQLRYDFAMNPVDSQCEPCVCCLSLEKSSPWLETLSRGMPIKGTIDNQPHGPEKLLEQLHIASFLMVPLFAKGSLWGFIGFGDCSKERIWNWSEASILLTMTSAIGGAMARWEAEDALRKSERKYRELVESSNSIIMRRDIHGNILFFNKYAQNFFGYSEDEIIGRNVVGSIVPPQDTTGRDLRSMIEEIGKHPESYAVNVNENEIGRAHV
jgi:PAS domain S-box-containing protein